MTPHRSYLWVGVPYSLVSAALFVWLTTSQQWSATVLLAAPLMLIGVWLDRSANYVAPGVGWSYVEVVGVAVLVLAPTNSVLLTAWLFGALSSIKDEDIVAPVLGRALLNAGQSSLGWTLAAGIYAGLVQPPAATDVQVLVAAGGALFVFLLLNAALTSLAVSVLYGPPAVVPIAVTSVLLVPMAAVLSLTSAAIATTVRGVGMVFLPVALLLIAPLVALPGLNLRLRLDRDSMRSAAIRALGARPESDLRTTFADLDQEAVSLGQRLGLVAREVEQLRYMVLLYATTGLYASDLARTWDQQLAGSPRSPFLSALYLGLAVDDLASAHIRRAAEMIAVASGEDTRDLLETEMFADLRLVAHHRHKVPRAYALLMRYHPESALQRPAAWLMRRSLRRLSGADHSTTRKHTPE